MASKSQHQAKVQSNQSTALTGYNLLLIDDDEDEYVLTRDLVYNMRARHHLDWVDNYEEAVKRVLQGLHDVYLVDYYMGKHTGVDLLKTVRERGSRAPIIILTGRDADGVDIEALEAGATDYLEKNAINATLLDRALRYAVRQQQNQNQLEDLVRQVSRLEQLKTDMIRIAAHDLRNPLTVMLGYLDLLREDVSQQLGDYTVYIDKMRESVTQMRQIVGDILSIERIAEMSGGYTEPVNFNAIIQTAYDQYRDQYPAHEWGIVLPEPAIIVYGAEPELREAVSNLLNNATKYTPEGGAIRVELSADADIALFTVTDTGYGIPTNMQEKLFQPFYRAKSKETRNIEGTGLGLHLVKNIIERHNGQVHFQSEYGKGSTFGFMLPQSEG